MGKKLGLDWLFEVLEDGKGYLRQPSETCSGIVYLQSMIIVSVSESLASWKGGWPQTSMNRMTPSDQTSAIKKDFWFFLMKTVRLELLTNCRCVVRIAQQNFRRRIGQTSAGRFQLLARTKFVTKPKISQFYHSQLLEEYYILWF